MRLSTGDHDRGQAGMTYVYPVVSRRSGGLSVGINLNPDNTCNWRCVYCQVPGLVSGNAPSIDLGLLERELREMLRLAREPAWLAANAPDGARAIRDVAIAGNGEPTSARELEGVVEIVGRVLAEVAPSGGVEVVLITNGSLVHRAYVQRALSRIRGQGGSVWFKLDSASDAGQARINSTRAGVARAAKNLARCAELVPTWVQTLVLDFDGVTLAGRELDRYCELLASLLAQGVQLRGVLLYGLARPSHQPEAPHLKALAPRDLETLAATIRATTGLEVRVHA